MRLTVTHTYSTTNIVVAMERRVYVDAVRIYAEDFSYDTQPGECPLELENVIDIKHVRRFDGMKEFTEWLMENQCVVEECHLAVVRDDLVCK